MKMPKNIFYKHLLLTILVSILITAVIAYIRVGPGQRILAFDMMLHRPFWDSVLLILLLHYIWLILPKKLAWIMISLMDTLFVILAIADVIKTQKLSEPIIPQDIYLINEGLDIAKNFLSAKFIIAIIFLLAVLVTLVFVIIKKVSKENIPFKMRLIMSFLSAFIVVIGAHADSDKVWAYMGLTPGQKDPMINVQDNGLVMGTYLQLADMKNNIPKDYTVQKAQELIKENSQPIYPLNSGVKPNIIVIQLEAFSDPTQLSGVTFNRDPIPFFRSLQQNYTSGEMGVSVFGGGTANSEFETLTSMTMKNIPYDTIAFSTQITHPMESAAWTLKEQDGYSASTVHDHYEWFYNRKTVYPYLGFGPNTFREEMAGNQNFGVLATDDNLVKYIIQHTKETKGQDFIMAISVQSHGPYPGWSAPSQPIKVTSAGKGLSQEGKNTIENYANVLNLVDNELKKLINYYQKSKEPTIIMMYGDHQPWLGDNKKFYYESGTLTPQDTLQNYQRGYHTPLLIWDNYLNQGHKEVDIGTSFAIPYILQEVGIQGNPLQTFLQKQMTKGVMEMPTAPYQKAYGWDAKSLQDYSYLQYYYTHQVQK